MRVALSDGGWCEFHQRVKVLGLPQVPDAGIVGGYAGLIAGRDARVLLLGITRALAGLGEHLTAIDFSETQIETLWPGDTASRRAVLGDWRELEPPSERFTAAIGDGCLSALEWPGDYCNVLERVADALEPGGILAVRCYVAPDAREPLEQVADDVLSGRERDWNAARWRVAMAAADADGNIAARDLAAAWRGLFEPLPDLVQRTGWNLEAMEMVLRSFERATLRYSFVTRAAVLDALPRTLANARFVPSGSYPLAEGCPFLVAERA